VGELLLESSARREVCGHQRQAARRLDTGDSAELEECSESVNPIDYELSMHGMEKLICGILPILTR
jgi:hypothetical protein